MKKMYKAPCVAETHAPHAHNLMKMSARMPPEGANNPGWSPRPTYAALPLFLRPLKEQGAFQASTLLIPHAAPANVPVPRQTHTGITADAI